METILPAATSLIPGIPVFSVDIVFFVLAVSRWSKHPRVSMYAASGSLLLLLVDVSSRALSVVLPLRLTSQGRDVVQLGVIFAVVGGVSALLHAVALGLLAAAVFVDRGPAAPVR